MVGVALFIEWQRRVKPLVPPLGSQVLASHPADLEEDLTRPMASRPLPLPEPAEDAYPVEEVLAELYPVDDQTLDLPLGPTTAEERLARPPQPAQEVRMAAPDDGYIPEPEDVATATAGAATTVLNAPPAVSLVMPLRSPAADLEQSMQAWSAQRQVVKRFLQQELVEGTDYYTLRIKGRETKPALSKAGSEKFLALFQLHATFGQDDATWQMLGQPQGTLCYVCHLHTRSGELVGEGRGARTVQQDGGDINKAVKMGQKSALVDAILRTGSLSDVFTQDLEPEATPASQPGASSAELRRRIWSLVTTADASITSRDACEAYVKKVTGLALEPNHYAEIERRLDARQGLER